MPFRFGRKAISIVTGSAVDLLSAPLSPACDSGTVFALCDSPGACSRERNGAPRQGGEDAMIRYGFTIRTRTGQRIDNVSIIAGSEGDAQRRLRQMYVQCEILECRERSIPRRFEAANVANMVDLLAINPPTIQHHG
jgi:hypothetical protein